MIFDTKIAILVQSDLQMWQKLNVTAFLASGIAGAVPNGIGEPYVDALGREHARLFSQPVVIFSASLEILQRAWQQSLQRDLTRAAYVRAMFAPGHDAANREVFRAENADTPDLVGLALHGPKKDIDKAIKGAQLHP